MSVDLSKLQEVKSYTPAQLAKRWQCSRTHIYTLIQDGTIQNTFKLGRLIRIKESEVRKIECGNLKSTEENTQPWHGLTAKPLDVQPVPRM